MPEQLGSRSVRVPSHHVINSVLPIKFLYHGHASLHRKWGCRYSEGGCRGNEGGCRSKAALFLFIYFCPTPPGLGMLKMKSVHGSQGSKKTNTYKHQISKSTKLNLQQETKKQEMGAGDDQ